MRLQATLAGVSMLLGMIIVTSTRFVVSESVGLVIVVILLALWVAPLLAGKRKKRRLPRTNKRRVAARKA